MSAKEKRVESFFQPERVSEFTLPDRKRRPAAGGQFVKLPRMTLDVSLDFLAPVLGIRLRPSIPAFTRMTVPETTVHENDPSPGSQHDVGFAR